MIYINNKSAMLLKINQITDHIVKQIKEVRRQIHRNPELAFCEINTSNIIKKELSQLENIEVFENYGETTAVIAVVRGKLPGRTIAIRSDIDALAIKEKTGLPFSSKKEGIMHACGHDAHIAIMLGVANVLCQLREAIRGNIVLVFQPAEEGFAGAKLLVEKGLLEDFEISEIYGYHIYPGLPLHTLGIRAGVITSNSDKINIEIKLNESKKGNRKSRDLASFFSHLIMAFQVIVSQEIPPNEPGVISIGKVDIKDEDLTIYPYAILKGTVRTMSLETRNLIEHRMKDVFRSMTNLFNIDGNLEYCRGYPSVVNEASLTKNLTELGEQYWGNKKVIQLENPLMMGEDFSFYSQKIPACYFLLGMGGDYDLHSPYFLFNEDILFSSIAWTSYLLTNMPFDPVKH
jgi:amidohydrolase